MRIFFAGSENVASIGVLQWAKVQNVLMSYYYLRDKSDEYIHNITTGYRNSGAEMIMLDSGAEMIMLDSGAHTFFVQGGFQSAISDAQSKKAELIVDPDEYFKGYKEWLETKKDMFDIIVELDIGKIVGDEKVRVWRQEFINIVGKDRACTVFHPDYMKSDYFEELCQASDYVACGAGLRQELSEWGPFTSIAKKYGTKLHGLAMTKSWFMERVPAFSADSTSWKSGTRFGLTYFWNGNKLVQIGDKAERRRMKNKLIEKGINWEKIEKDDNTEVDKMNVIAWKQYQDWLDKKLGKDNQTPKSLEDGSQKSKEFLENKGKIAELRKNPEIEKKRIENLRAAMRGNMFAFKNGKQSMLLPYYCNDCYNKSKCKFFQEPKEEGDKVLCALREDFKTWFSPEQFDYREEEAVNETRNRVMNILLSRAGFNLYSELLDGGIQNKSLSAMLFNISDRLSGGKGGINLNQININNNINNSVNVQVAEAIQNLDEQSRRKILEVLERNNDGQEQSDKPEGGFMAVETPKV